MRKYIIAAHGKMASGIKTTLEVIIGPQENVICIDAYTDECADPMPEFQKIIEENQDDEIVIMTDMFGGSVNNNAMLLMRNENVYVVTGINLAVVISIVMSNQLDDTAEILRQAVGDARDNIIFCNELNMQINNEEDDF